MALMGKRGRAVTRCEEVVCMGGEEDVAVSCRDMSESVRDQGRNGVVASRRT